MAGRKLGVWEGMGALDPGVRVTIIRIYYGNSQLKYYIKIEMEIFVLELHELCLLGSTSLTQGSRV